jgi:hypothetical protein
VSHLTLSVGNRKVANICNSALFPRCGKYPQVTYIYIYIAAVGMRLKQKLWVHRKMQHVTFSFLCGALSVLVSWVALPLLICNPPGTYCSKVLVFLSVCKSISTTLISTFLSMLPTIWRNARANWAIGSVVKQPSTKNGIKAIESLKEAVLVSVT